MGKHFNSHLKTNKECKAQLGFSLIELIIVIAIMAVLIGLVAPNFVKYAAEQRKKTCRQNRESILKVYESAVYDTSNVIELDKNDLQNLVDGNFSFYDIDEYYKKDEGCPNKGIYVAFLGDEEGGDATVACIHCPECDAADECVSLNMIHWESTTMTEESDTVTEPPHTTEPHTDEPESSEEESSSEEPPYDYDGVWPYPDIDEWWDGSKTPVNQLNDANNASIQFTTPSQIFKSRAGGSFVFIDTNGAGSMKVYYKEAMTPEYYSSKYPQYLIPLTGTQKSMTMGKNGLVITEMTNGDIYNITYNGQTKKWVYFHQAGGGQSESFSTADWNKTKNGNFYLVAD